MIRPIHLIAISLLVHMKYMGKFQVDFLNFKYEYDEFFVRRTMESVQFVLNARWNEDRLEQ